GRLPDEGLLSGDGGEVQVAKHVMRESSSDRKVPANKCGRMKRWT
ncbi:hypothetical protein LEMLEM_LOCUS19692, partial [Lemmus lemmus]